MTKIIRIGVDTSKSIFVLHGVDSAEGPVLRRKLRRGQFLEFFAKLEATKIGLEACGASHHWARELQKFGHQVVLLPPQYVKPYVKRNKNDAGCGGDLRGDESADDAVCAGEDGRAASGAHAGRHA